VAARSGRVPTRYCRRDTRVATRRRQSRVEHRPDHGRDCSARP
jgi:hypothetical protein